MAHFAQSLKLRLVFFQPGIRIRCFPVDERFCRPQPRELSAQHNGSQIAETADFTGHKHALRDSLGQKHLLGFVVMDFTAALIQETDLTLPASGVADDVTVNSYLAFRLALGNGYVSRLSDCNSF